MGCLTPSYEERGRIRRGVQNFSQNNRVCFLVKHPSGDGDAVYQFVIKIVAEVLVFIKDCRTLFGGVVIFIMLLAGFVPHLQVTFIDVVGRIYLLVGSL